MFAEAGGLTASTQRLHHEVDARLLSAQASAQAREHDAFQMLLVGSALSLGAAVVLALLLARAVSRPVARLAAGAREIGAGRLDYRLAAGSPDEIGVVATEFNRMAAELESAHSTLERRVRERTSELAEANRELDLHRAEQERLAHERRMLLRRVISAQEEERRRIGRELHDEAGQSLTALGLGLEAARAELGAGERQQLDQRLRSMGRVATDALEELGRLVVDLRPAQLDRLGLVPTLRWYVGRVDSGVRARLTVTGRPRRLAPEVETTVFRIAQEALTNVVRHARASRADVTLSFEADRLTLEVTDDGMGFDSQAISRAPSSIGLIGMRERAQLVGGALAIRSRPGEGARLTITVPLEGERR